MSRNLFFISLILVTRVLASEATFDIRIVPAGDFKGKTTTVTGFAVMNGGKVTANNIKVDLRTVKTGVELRDKHTQKHLETEKFPEAVLVHAEGENGAGRGTLKIRGIEKPVNGTYKIIGKELAAEFHIKLADYGITGIKYMSMGVDDDVTLHVRVPLTAGAAAAPVAAKKAPTKKN